MKQIIANRHKWMTTLLLIAPVSVFAAGPPVPSEINNPLAQILLLLIAVLALCIILLARVVLGTAQINWQKRVSDTQKTVTVIILLGISNGIFAQDATVVAAAPSTDYYGGLSATSFWSLISTLLIECIILFALLYNLKFLLQKESKAKVVIATVPQEAKESTWQKWWDKLNSFRPVKEEAQIDLGHNYDGIRELDNRLPPWWLYGFYLTILFAGIYLWRYHVAHTAPLSAEELKIAMVKADEEKTAYLKMSANNIDESNVTLLKDAQDIAAGKGIFTAVCATCHKTDGGGLVGPNLTDDYWIHGGSVKDIFKTIKYGVPEKGMQAWKESYSPRQMAQLTAYIKSIYGTNPPSPKEPQGVMYREESTASDSTTVKTDSTVVKLIK